MRLIATGIYEIRLGMVNAFVISDGDDLVLIDAGQARQAGKIQQALGTLGKSLADLTHIIVTHCHPDHAGSLAAVQRASSATTLMHSADAELVRQGLTMRPVTPSPGLLKRMLFALFVKRAPQSIDACRVERTVTDDEQLDIAGGLRVIHTPGHTAGHIALYCPRRSVLLVGDAAMNQAGLDTSLCYEDHDLGAASLGKLAQLDFEAAGFGHGRAIRRGAAARFRRKWAAEGRD